MTERQEFFTPQEAAEHLRFSVATLAIWRSQGRGPSYVKVGKPVRYLRDDLTAWAVADAADRKRIEETARCHQEARSRTKRARGRVGAAQRKRRLSSEPWCRDCLNDKCLIPAEQIDHIVPLSLGGPDTDENVRALCGTCHARRTRELSRRGSDGASEVARA